MFIESKDFSPHTGQKDRKLIPVEDIVEIEHTDGVKFELRYMDRKGTGKSVSGFGAQGGGKNVGAAIGGLLSKMKKKDTTNAKTAKGEDADGDQEKQQRCDTFSSKHVKDVIETFNDVLQVMDQYEEEINRFANDESPSEDEETPTGSNAPKVVKAVILNK